MSRLQGGPISGYGDKTWGTLLVSRYTKVGLLDRAELRSSLTIPTCKLCSNRSNPKQWLADHMCISHSIMYMKTALYVNVTIKFPRFDPTFQIASSTAHRRNFLCWSSRTPKSPEPRFTKCRTYKCRVGLILDRTFRTETNILAPSPIRNSAMIMISFILMESAPLLLEMKKSNPWIR